MTAAGSTLEAMRRQEAIYLWNKNPAASSPSLTDVEVHQAIVALESIHDLCQMQDRETLVIATSYLLRYLHTATSTPRPVGFVALVCFYMAVKIHQTTALPLTSLTDLYQRFFSSCDDDVPKWEHVELEVCCALQWRLHPPMPMAFVDQHLSSITGSSSSMRRHRRRAQARLDAAFRADPIAFTGDYRASSLAQAALWVTAKNPNKTLDDADVVDDAVAFLKDCAASTTTTTTTAIKKSSRKRCVTPPPPSPGCYGGIMARPSKKIKTLEDHGWTNSPRSALTVAEEEEEV